MRKIVISVLVIVMGLVCYSAYRKHQDEQPLDWQMLDQKVVVSGVQITHQTWMQLAKVPATSEPINLSKDLAKVIASPDGYKIRVSNKLNFRNWVRCEILRKCIQDKACWNHEKNPTPYQAAEIAAAIVCDKFSYDADTARRVESKDPMDRMELSYEGGGKKLQASDDAAADKLLMTSKPTVCRHYARCTAAIFQELRQLYPDSLHNAHMATITSVNLQHAWNMLVIIKDPHNIVVGFIDPTEADENWEYRAPNLLEFSRLLDYYESSRLLPVEDGFKARLKYFTKGKAHALSIWDYIQFGTDPSLPWEKAGQIQMCNALLARPKDELRRTSKFTKGDVVRETKYQLLDLYLDPTNYWRPDDWYSKSQQLLKDLKKIDPKEAKYYDPLPACPEQYFAWRLYKRSMTGCNPRNANEDYLQDMKKMPQIEAWAKKHNKIKIWWHDWNINYLE